ncbi:GrpE-domain-containing protein [Meredithblackwellia eburnea MCA 4105]
MASLSSSNLAQVVRSAARQSNFARRSSAISSLRTLRSYSTAKEEPKEGETPKPASDADAKVTELKEQLEQKNKAIAELKDARLRSLADFENLQKISTREKAQAKEFALTSFARDLIASIDILDLAIKSIPQHKIVKDHADAVDGAAPNEDLVSLHQGVSLTRREIEKVLNRHGVTAFDPTGQPFDPNLHEALYQAPVPGKEPGTVLETQETGYMLNSRLLRPAKVGVVLAV